MNASTSQGLGELLLAEARGFRAGILNAKSQFVNDASTHVGQIAILRRLAGGPVKGENYHKAEVVAGRVGAEQTAPKREF